MTTRWELVITADAEVILGDQAADPPLEIEDGED